VAGKNSGLAVEFAAAKITPASQNACAHTDLAQAVVPKTTSRFHSKTDALALGRPRASRGMLGPTFTLHTLDFTGSISASLAGSRAWAATRTATAQGASSCEPEITAAVLRS
jgi:hypothetical protein